MDPSSLVDLGLFADQVEPFLRSFHDPRHHWNDTDVRGRFAHRRGGPTDLYGACDAVFLYWITGRLQASTTEAGRAEWATLIRSFQDPTSGLFLPGEGSGHGAAHATGFATAALRLLGHAPAHRFAWAPDAFGSAAAVERWLDHLGWTIVWRGSHAAGLAAAVLDAPGCADVPEPWSTWVLDGLRARVDARTGLWKRSWLDRVWRRPTTIDLGGAAHFWWLFERCAQPPPRADAAFASILRLQRPNGIWGSRLHNGAFPQGIDFDALHGLRYAWPAQAASARPALRTRALAALDRYGAACDRFLNTPGAVGRLFHTTHKLVGTANAIAEGNRLATALGRPPIFRTPRPWCSALTEVCWQ